MASFSRPSQLLFAGMIIQRDPIVLRRLSEYEQAYYSYSDAFQREKSKGLFEIKIGEAEDEAKAATFSIASLKPLQAATEPPSDPTCLGRHGDRKLYLFSKQQDSSWGFPRWALPEDCEAPHARARGGLSDLFEGDYQLYHLGRAPVAVQTERFTDRVAPPFSQRTFYFKSRLVSGHMNIGTEFQWLTREEIKAKVPVGYWGAIKDVLSE